MTAREGRLTAEDEEWALAVFRDALEDVRMRREIDEIIIRGKALRRRRRQRRAIPAVTMLGLVLGLAIGPHLGGGVTAAAPAKPPPIAPVSVSLADWSVHASADGVVTVTLTSLGNPAELVAALGKAGIPAEAVTLSWPGPVLPSCVAPSQDAGQAQAPGTATATPVPLGVAAGAGPGFFTDGPAWVKQPGGSFRVTFNRAHLPRGVILQIFAIQTSQGKVLLLRDAMVPAEQARLSCLALAQKRSGK
jgi:hypothetical protein